MAKRKVRKSPYIPPQSEVVNRKQRRPTDSKARSTGGAGGNRGYKPGREPQPPSWMRTFKQVPIYYVLIVGVNYLLTPGKDAHGHALKGVARLELAASSSLLVVLAFVPLMYFLDRSRWRRYTGGTDAAAEPKPKRKRGQGIIAR